MDEWMGGMNRMASRAVSARREDWGAIDLIAGVRACGCY